MTGIGMPCRSMVFSSRAWFYLPVHCFQRSWSWPLESLSFSFILLRHIWMGEFALLGNWATLSAHSLYVKGWEPKAHFKTSADRLVLWQPNALQNLQGFLFVFWLVLCARKYNLTVLFWDLVFKSAALNCFLSSVALFLDLGKVILGLDGF